MGMPPLWTSRTNDRGYYLVSYAVTEDGVCYRHLVPKFKRSVILLVDALKFEFLASGVPLQDQAKAYHNKVPVVTNLIRNQPENAALFRFIADAPTTTMQRIKGLTTGWFKTYQAGTEPFPVEFVQDKFLGAWDPG